MSFNPGVNKEIKYSLLSAGAEGALYHILLHGL
jgi:hypothetical protein